MEAQRFDVEKIELVKKSIEQGTLPRFVYKYYKLTKFTETVLEENKIWFGSPTKFNDPFDCQLIPNTTNKKKEIEEYLKRNSSHNRALRKSEADQLIRNPFLWKDIVSESLEKVISNSGVTSFCGSNRNILMWSHYSDSHKGICLKFDIYKSPETFLFPIKVIYSDDYPTFNYLKDTDKIIDFLFQTKSNHWMYEEELRVVMKNVGKYHFSKNSLVEITFGCKTEEDDIKKYLNILKNKNYSNFKVTVAKPSNSKFELDIIDY